MHVVKRLKVLRFLSSLEFDFGLSGKEYISYYFLLFQTRVCAFPPSCAPSILVHVLREDKSESRTAILSNLDVAAIQLFRFNTSQPSISCLVGTDYGLR